MSSAARRALHVRELACDQAGLLTRIQLRQLGVSAGMLRGHIAAARWTPLSRRVVALQTGPLTTDQVRWFAVLDSGDRAALAGLSALHAFGLQGFPLDRLHVAVPPDGRGAQHPLFVRRRSRRLDDSAIHPARRPPCMRPEIALVDALEHSPSPLRGCALLAAVVQQRLLRAADLQPLVEAEATLPNRGLYLPVAGDIAGGAHSLLEIDFVSLARRAGVPAPLGQSVRTDRQGRRRYLDADFGAFGVEVDGAIHLKPLTWWADMARLNDIVIAGKPMLRFASVAIRLHPEQVIDQLRRAAARWL